MEEEEINISEIIDVLKSKWRVIVIITLMTTIISVFYSFFMIVPIYTSSLKVFIAKSVTSKVDYNAGDIMLYQNLLKTYSELLKNDDLIERAVDNSGLDVSVTQVKSGFSVTEGEDTSIMTITYSCNDIELSKNVLDIVTDEFIIESKEFIPSGSVKIIEKSKYPVYPDNLDSSRNILIGIVAGIFMGITIVLFMEYINNTFKTKERVESTLKIPVIGVIPFNGDIK